MINTIDRTNPPELKSMPELSVREVQLSRMKNGIPVYSMEAGFQDVVKVELLFPNTTFNPAMPLLHSAVNRQMSEGTTKHKAKELADALDYYGAFYETDENSDYCSVNLFTLRKYLGETLPLVNEILTEAIFPEKELSVYIQNQKQRLAVDNEKVQSLARKKFNQLIYGNQHPYGFHVMPSDYDALNSAALLSHYREQYHAGNCTMIISGRADQDSINESQKIFGSEKWLAEKNIAATMPEVKPAPELKHRITKDGAVQTAIRIGKRLFNRTHPDYAAFTVLNTILGGYFGSRLMTNIREEKGYTYGIGSAIVSMKHDGYFFISTEVGADVTTDALSEIYREIDLMKTELVSSDELETVRNYMLGNFMKSIDGAFQLADRFKSIYLNGLTYDYYRLYLEKLKSIQPEEIQELAVKYLDTASFYEVLVGKV